MRYTFLSLFAIASLASCTSVDRRTLAEYDDGIYSWDPYPIEATRYYDQRSQDVYLFGDDGYNDGYDEGYNDAFYSVSGPYASPYFSYRPRNRRWSYSPFQYYPSYYYGYNSPYMTPFGMNPYGMTSPWSPWGYGYPGCSMPGYGYPYGGYGYGSYGYGGYGYGGYGSPWGGMTGSTPGNGGAVSNPVGTSSNISIRRMDISGGPQTRRPSVENVTGRQRETSKTIQSPIESAGRRSYQIGEMPQRPSVVKRPHSVQDEQPIRSRATPRTTEPQGTSRSIPSPASRPTSQEKTQRSSPSSSPATRSSAPAQSSPSPSRSTGGRGGR